MIGLFFLITRIGATLLECWLLSIRNLFFFLKVKNLLVIRKIFVAYTDKKTITNKHERPKFNRTFKSPSIVIENIVTKCLLNAVATNHLATVR